MADNLINVKVDDKELKRLARKLGVASETLPKILVGAIRSTATSTKTIIKNNVRKALPELPAGQIAKRIYIKPKATRTRLSTIIHIVLKTIPLKKIRGVKGKGRYRGKKYKSSYITWKGRMFPQAFKATMPSGHQGIFMQKFADRSKPILTWTGDIIGAGQPLIGGLPIQELGVSVGDVYHNASGVKQNIDKQSTEKLRINIVKRFNRLVK